MVRSHQGESQAMDMLHIVQSYPRFGRVNIELNKFRAEINCLIFTDCIPLKMSYGKYYRHRTQAFLNMDLSINTFITSVSARHIAFK